MAPVARAGIVKSQGRNISNKIYLIELCHDVANFGLYVLLFPFLFP